VTPSLYNSKFKGKVASLTNRALQSQRQNNDCSNKISSHVDFGRVDAIFDVTFHSNQHNVWIYFKNFSNQACSLLILPIFSTFMTPAEDNADKLGLKNSKGISSHNPSIYIDAVRISNNRKVVWLLISWLQSFPV
jgi:hypothetical protein